MKEKQRLESGNDLHLVDMSSRAWMLEIQCTKINEIMGQFDYKSPLGCFKGIRPV